MMVATPGRLMDLLDKKMVNLDICRSVNVCCLLILEVTVHFGKVELLCNVEAYCSCNSYIHIHTYFIYLYTGKSSVYITIKKVLLQLHCFTRLPCGSPTGSYYIVGEFPF